MYYVILYSSSLDSYNSSSLFVCSSDSRESAISLLVSYVKSSSVDGVRILSVREFLSIDLFVNG